MTRWTDDGPVGLRIGAGDPIDAGADFVVVDVGDVGVTASRTELPVLIEGSVRDALAAGADGVVLPDDSEIEAALDAFAGVRRHRVPRVLTIAGSDSGGGAGIQADLKTIAALGGYGCSVVTAVTAQNTRAVTCVHAIPPDVVLAQIRAVRDDLRIDAVKIGMLGDVATIEAVTEGLEGWDVPIVLDPVMVSKSGAALLQPDAVRCLIDRLVPIATVLTPNLPEAEVLSGRPVVDVESTGRALADLGPAVVMKGGHAEGSVLTDLLVADRTWSFTTRRIATDNTHGTGCSMSAAIATYLGWGRPLDQAVGEAHAWLAEAIAGSHQVRIGHGHGPIHHFVRGRVGPGKADG